MCTMDLKMGQLFYFGHVNMGQQKIWKRDLFKTTDGLDLGLNYSNLWIKSIGPSLHTKVDHITYDSEDQKETYDSYYLQTEKFGPGHAADHPGDKRVLSNIRPFISAQTVRIESKRIQIWIVHYSVKIWVVDCEMSGRLAPAWQHLHSEKFRL